VEDLLALMRAWQTQIAPQPRPRQLSAFAPRPAADDPTARNRKGLNSYPAMTPVDRRSYATGPRRQMAILDARAPSIISAEAYPRGGECSVL